MNESRIKQRREWVSLIRAFSWLQGFGLHNHASVFLAGTTIRAGDSDWATYLMYVQL